MKLIIAGSRSLDMVRPDEIGAFVGIHDLGPSEVVSGMAYGIDHVGMLWAEKNHIPITKFLPKWSEHGKAAGPIRNRAMAEYADALLLIWDGKSRGSFNMKSEMVVLGKPVHEIVIKCYKGKK